jgi:hypothetical protein
VVQKQNIGPPCSQKQNIEPPWPQNQNIGRGLYLTRAFPHLYTSGAHHTAGVRRPAKRNRHRVRRSPGLAWGAFLLGRAGHACADGEDGPFRGDALVWRGVGWVAQVRGAARPGLVCTASLLQTDGRLRTSVLQLPLKLPPIPHPTRPPCIPCRPPPALHLPLPFSPTGGSPSYPATSPALASTRASSAPPTAP